MTSLGKQIQEAREKIKMTQEELADAMGVSAEDIAAWENDESTPKEKQLQAMGDKLGTVLLDPRSAAARQKADAKLEQVKEAEFLGKKTHGSGMGNPGQSKMWLIPLAAAALLAILLFGWIQPQISNLNAQVTELSKAVKESEEALNGMPILRDPVYSEGTKANMVGGYDFSCSKEGNRFSLVVFQLLDRQGRKVLTSFGEASAKGLTQGEYVHELPTGEYPLMFKANGSLKDEGVAVTAYLINGKTYCYEYEVEKFSAEEIIVTHYQFWNKNAE